MTASEADPVPAGNGAGAPAPRCVLAHASRPSVHSVVLLGGARLMHPEGVAPLERKQAALLAYAALEGEASRPRLRGLLWPNSDESRASANLRQLLHRLRQLSGEALFGHENPVILRPSLSVDVREMESSAVEGQYARVLAWRGELLDGLDYEDCPEFEQWLHRTRERQEALRERATNAELDRLEREGRPADAIAVALYAVSCGPVREELYRRLMRLQLAEGDRAAAARTFQRCSERLRTELDVGPAPETERLAREFTLRSPWPPGWGPSPLAR